MSFVRNNRFWTGFALGAAGTILAGALWLNLTSPPPAFGQIPDAGEQRNEIIKELRANNRTLTEMAGLLRDIRDDARQGKSRKADATTQPSRP